MTVVRDSDADGSASVLPHTHNIRQLINLLFFCQLLFCFFSEFCLAQVSLMLSWFGLTVLLVERSTSITMSQRSRARIPSIREQASNDKNSDSAELRETAVCFLHIQLMGTNVRLPMMHRIPLEVDMESPKSPAKSESRNHPSRQCSAVLPTWQYCL